MLIGLSGYAQAGKDTVGRFLVEGHGYVRYAFADKLRDCLYALDPVVVVGDNGEVSRVQEIVDNWGWDMAKGRFDEVRALLQRLGTEAGRNVLGDNVWVDATFNDVDRNGSANVVITDVRFPNEAQAIKAKGGIVARVRRTGVNAVNSHISERALEEWPFDVTIPNDGSLDALRGNTEWLAKEAPRIVMNGPTNPLPGYGAPTPRRVVHV